MSTILRRLGRLDRVAAGYALVYYAWLTAGAAGVAAPAIVGDLAFFPLGLAIAWVNWRNSRIEGLDRRTRLAWRLLALAALVLWASGTAWSIMRALDAPPEAARNVDRIGFVQFALAIAGYLTFPARPFPRHGRIRFALDVALIAVAGFVIAFYMGLRLLQDHAEPATLAILESSVDWALFVVAAVSCTQKRDRIIGRVLVLLLASNLVSMAANYLLAILPAYQSGHPIDGLWFSAWVLRWVAARLAWHHYTAAPAAVGLTTPPDQDYRSNPFAYLLVAGAFLLLLIQIYTGNREFLPMLTVAATGMGGLLIVRQFAELEENRRLFEAQVEGESRYRSLVQNSSDVVIVVDEGGVISYVSPSVAAVFKTNVYVRPGIPFRQLFPPDAAGMADGLLAGDPGTARRWEAAMQVAPGRWREVEAACSDLRSDPAVRGIVITCRDVTERNEVERHLRQAQKLDAVGHLAGGLAHDLNNVLGIIRGYAELLRSDLPEASAAGRDLDQILKAVDRAAGVTGRVLAFSRKQPGQVKILDLNAVIEGLAPILKHLMKDQVEVRLNLGPGLWPVRADQGQIEQVVVNLTSNACDAMPGGGVIIIQTANRPSADASETAATQPGDWVELSVADRGCGMSADLVTRIFEPFFSTKPKDQALGLGLSIVHGIVADAGGRVLVDSDEGRGARFTVLLPRAR
jgi:PAS domain S-box-containing protein